MKILKRVVLTLLIFVILVIIGFVLWAETPSQPTEIALQALISGAQVIVTEHSDFITFEPANQRTSTGFIFYPGGRVDYRAYAPVLREIAEQGYFVAVVKVKLNLAIFDTNAADAVIDGNPHIGQWAVGGHSVGGVAAGIYAREHLDVVRAIAFWASYPADGSFKDSNIPVLSLHGTQDGLASEVDIASARALLPAETKYVTIEGGNHSQFGSYGLQPGDNPATISPDEQWRQVAEATVQLLASLVN